MERRTTRSRLTSEASKTPEPQSRSKKRDKDVEPAPSSAKRMRTSTSNARSLDIDEKTRKANEEEIAKKASARSATKVKAKDEPQAPEAPTPQKPASKQKPSSAAPRSVSKKTKATAEPEDKPAKELNVNTSPAVLPTYLFSAAPQETKEPSSLPSNIKDVKLQPWLQADYERFQAKQLAKKVSASSTPDKGEPQYVLPSHYRSLESLFQALEVACGYLEVRRQLCTFDRIQEAIQNTRRSFSLLNLAQILAVFREAYVVKAILQSNQGKLVIMRTRLDDPNRDYSNDLTTIVDSEKEIANRKDQFHKRLVERVKTAHQAFLKKIKFSAKKAESLEGWHPKFSLEEVPEIERASLPSLPSSKDLKDRSPNSPIRTPNSSPKTSKLRTALFSTSAAIPPGIANLSSSNSEVPNTSVATSSNTGTPMEIEGDSPEKPSAKSKRKAPTKSAKRVRIIRSRSI
eukprot:TRINITY_DN11650_c0_g1_i1.p1 TRINITY_DN11650_c0_g1~~TRINITY_DN11650_c0_g1_i1.p1  ORF type:complete len:459 (-),score=88.71 TRINITY_DN11650_c0_g1_i1:479-1855(-)